MTMDDDNSPGAVVRRAIATFEAEGLEAAMVDVIRAKHRAPGDPGLLVFVGPLFEADKRRLALEILEDYCGEHPEDELAQIRLDELHDANEARDAEEAEDDDADLADARRELPDGSILVHDREFEASGGGAAVVLACARHIARLAADIARRWWEGEAHDGEGRVAPAGDGSVEVAAAGGMTRVPLALLQWAIEAAYVEHLGFFGRWLFDVPPRGCIAGQGDREAAMSAESFVRQLARNVAAKSLSGAAEDAERQSLIRQARGYGLFDEPLLAVKLDALRAMGCPNLARWTQAVIELEAYFASEWAGRVQRAQPASALSGPFSLDFPAAAPVPGDVDKHRWWAWCESQFEGGRGTAQDSGFIIASAGRTFGKLYFRTENGRRVLYAVDGKLR